MSGLRSRSRASQLRPPRATASGTTDPAFHVIGALAGSLAVTGGTFTQPDTNREAIWLQGIITGAVTISGATANSGGTAILFTNLQAPVAITNVVATAALAYNGLVFLATSAAATSIDITGGSFTGVARGIYFVGAVDAATTITLSAVTATGGSNGALEFNGQIDGAVNVVGRSKLVGGKEAVKFATLVSATGSVRFENTEVDNVGQTGHPLVSFLAALNGNLVVKQCTLKAEASAIQLAADLAGKVRLSLNTISSATGHGLSPSNSEASPRPSLP